MKKLSMFFNAVVGVIIVSFVLSVATAIRESRKAAQPQERTIPLPQMNQ